MPPKKARPSCAPCREGRACGGRSGLREECLLWLRRGSQPPTLSRRLSFFWRQPLRPRESRSTFCGAADGVCSVAARLVEPSEVLSATQIVKSDSLEDCERGSSACALMRKFNARFARKPAYLLR